MDPILDPSIQIARHLTVPSTQSRTAENYAFIDLAPTSRSNYLKFNVTFTDPNAQRYVVSLNRMPSPVNTASNSRCALFTVEITSNKPFSFTQTLTKDGQSNVYPPGTSIVTILVAELGTERDAFILTP